MVADCHCFSRLAKKHLRSGRPLRSAQLSALPLNGPSIHSCTLWLRDCTAFDSNTRAAACRHLHHWAEQEKARQEFVHFSSTPFTYICHNTTAVHAQRSTAVPGARQRSTQFLVRSCTTHSSCRMHRHRHRDSGKCKAPKSSQTTQQLQQLQAHLGRWQPCKAGWARTAHASIARKILCMQKCTPPINNCTLHSYKPSSPFIPLLLLPQCTTSCCHCSCSLGGKSCQGACCHAQPVGQICLRKLQDLQHHRNPPGAPGAASCQFLGHPLMSRHLQSQPIGQLCCLSPASAALWALTAYWRAVPVRGRDCTGRS